MKKHSNSGKYTKIKTGLYKESKCKFETFVKWNKELLIYLFFRLVLVYKVFSRHVSTVKPQKKKFLFEFEFDAMIA